MSFVRNLFFSVFLGVWGTLSAQEERVIPVPREVLPGTGEFRISEVTAWHTNLSGAEKESLVNTRMARKVISSKFPTGVGTTYSFPIKQLHSVILEQM